LESLHSDFEAETVTLKGEWLWCVVEIVSGGVPTILDVRFMCLLKSLGRILLEGSVSKNLFNPIRHQLYLGKVQVGIRLLGNIYLMADIIPQGVNFAVLLGQRSSFSMCSLSTIRFCMSSVLRELALACAWLPARPSNKTSLKV
jgi:hypothetical protein